MQHHLRHIHKAISTPEYFKILILRTIGNFLILSSCFMIGKTFYEPIKQEARYFIDRQTQKEYLVGTQEDKEVIENSETVPKNLLANLFKVKPVEVLVPADPEFSIVIPKIGANAKVLPNVDPADDKVYLDALKQGVAHASGTAFPGEEGHIFLFAHSTDYVWNVSTYNAIFYLLNKLEANDEINIFYKGRRHVYKVIKKEIIDPTQVEYLTRKTNKEFLTLQTCWPPGTTLQRMLVYAVPVSD